MPFQAGSRNYELSFVGKTLRLAAVPVVRIWPAVSTWGWEQREVMPYRGSGIFSARHAVRWGGSQWLSRGLCSNLGSDSSRDFGPIGVFRIVEPCCSVGASSSRRLVLSISFSKDFAFQHVHLSPPGKAFSLASSSLC